MFASTRFNTLCYGMIALGTLVSLFAALEPFYTAGYHLRFSVLSMGLLPYLAYGIPVTLFQRTITIVAGVILLIVHAGSVFVVRVIDPDNLVNGIIYLAPLIITAFLLPLVVVAWRQPWHD